METRDRESRRARDVCRFAVPRDGDDSKRAFAVRLPGSVLVANRRQRYSDLFITAKMARGMQAYRTINTIHLAVANFCAQVLFHGRALRADDDPPSGLRRQAIGQILDIVHTQYRWAPRLMLRFQWPLLMAAISTDDGEQRDWLRQRLEEVSGRHSGFAWACRVADEVEKQGQRVDLAEVFRLCI